MLLNEWVNLAAAVVGMLGTLVPYITAYGRSKSFVGSTKRIKELITAKKELLEILSEKSTQERYPSSEYINRIIHDINGELERIEKKKQIGLFIAFSTIEVGVFFLLTFAQISDLLSKRVLGSVDEGGYGFWENALEPVSFRIILILILTVISISITLQLIPLLERRFNQKYLQMNVIMILLFNIISAIVFFAAWWGLVWIDRLTDWL